MSPRHARTAALTVAALCSALLTLPPTLSSAAGSGSGSGSGSGGKEGIRIHELQGSTRVSPFAGERVSGVPGVVTAVRGSGEARGFWLQDPEPDDDPATSEGIFVLTGDSTPDVSEGDALRVSGKIVEYYPDGRKAGGQSVTQLTGAEWRTTGTGEQVPGAVRVDAHRIPHEYAPEGAGEDGSGIEELELRPAEYALDAWESLEGMRTAVENAPVTGATSDYGDLWVTAAPSRNPTPRGGIHYSSYTEQNGARVKVSSLSTAGKQPFPKADVGDELSGTTEGPLDYDEFGGYTIRATALGELRDNGLERERTREQRAGELSVATYNVENLSPASEPEKFTRLAKALVGNLSSPDIVNVEEVQDDTGPKDDGTVSAGRTLDRLTAAISEAGGPSYEWRQIDPEDNADGGQPGGNIRVAFLYNPDRVSFTDRAGGGSTTPVEVEDDGGTPALSASPGRIAPEDEAWKAARKPLAGEFRFRGRPVFVVANHFSSKGGGDLKGDEPMEGRFQPPARHSEPQRVEQAELVNSFARDIRHVDPDAAVVAAGDLNDFDFSPSLKTLRSGGALTSPMRKLPEAERYGYVFNGNSQSLDHILTSPGAGPVDYDIVHINAEFHDQSSDHDPTVARLRMPTP